MKCPKCQHDNPPDTLFCEECDHRTDQPYKEKMAIPVVYLIAAALALGIIALITYFFELQWFIPVAAGGVGLFLGGYSMSLARMSRGNDRMTLLALAGAAIAASAVGFMLGITLY